MPCLLEDDFLVLVLVLVLVVVAVAVAVAVAIAIVGPIFVSDLPTGFEYGPRYRGLMHWYRYSGFVGPFLFLIAEAGVPTCATSFRYLSTHSS